MVDERVDPVFSPLLSNPRMALRAPPAHVTITQFRQAADQFLAVPARTEIEAVKFETVPSDAGPISVKLYYPSSDTLPLVFFIHGGGFVFGNLDTHDELCRLLASQSNAVVAALNYRLAPEHPYPAALEDCQVALAWLIGQAEALRIDASKLALCGDSAGGQLAICLALDCLQRQTPIRHLGLLYPLIDPAGSTKSAQLYGEGYMVTSSFIQWAWLAYGANTRTLDDPLFNLMHADLKGLPATSIVTAEFDPLRDEGELFGAKLSALGVAASVTRYPGMIHGFAGLSQYTPVAGQAIKELAQTFSAAFGG